jgi:hypothetical protein
VGHVRATALLNTQAPVEVVCHVLHRERQNAEYYDTYSGIDIARTVQSTDVGVTILDTVKM